MSVTTGQSDDVLVEAERVVNLVRSLRGRRTSISAKRRHQIGERAGWICHICAQPVDKTLTHLPARPIDPAHLDYLAERGPAHVAEIIEWIGQDVDRARAAYEARWKWPNDYSEATSRASQTLYKHAGPLAEVYWRRNEENPTVEHIVPVSVGGTDDDDNLAIAHRKCNCSPISNAPNRTDIQAASSASAFLSCLADLRAGKERPLVFVIQAFAQVCAWLERAGRADEVPTGLREQLPAALDRLVEPHRARWEAAREAQYDILRAKMRARQLEREIDDQKRICAELDAKIASLKLRPAITRWKRKRDYQRRKLKLLHTELQELTQDQQG